MSEAFNTESMPLPDQFARALVTALCERDEYTREHSDRVAVLATILGVECGLTQRQLYLLGIAATMHDIGKLGIPDNILLKPAGFIEDEWEIMKSHAIRGERILRSIELDGMDEVATAVRHHHEHFDGGGYPDRLAGEDIPVISRILSIVDSYDAMSMTRPYHPPRTHAQVMEILHKEQGGKHDPAILERFRICTERSH
jgi:HD-GYP domain-containing protein (c-di-GMP phosphodiesterase class II)